MNANTIAAALTLISDMIKGAFLGCVLGIFYLTTVGFAPDRAANASNTGGDQITQIIASDTN
jgi:F0F1-type ATP synthase assembly protein I